MLDYAKFIGETVVTVNQTYYTNPCTAVMPDCDIIAKAVFTSNGTPVQQTYNVKVITEGYGTAYASKVSAFLGQQVNIIAIPDSNNLLDSITSNDVRINAYSFTMPEKDVTVYVKFAEDYSNLIATPHSYIFSYNESGDLIVTNSNRTNEPPYDTVSITVKLGEDYAGKSCVLYTGRKASGGTVVEEAVLDENGRATFNVAIRKNFHLIVSE